MSTTGKWASWAGWLIFVEVVLMLAGMSIAAGGAVTSTGEVRDDQRYLGWSIIVTLISGGIFYAAHMRAKLC